MNATIAGLIRHIITILGGGLVAKGHIDETGIETVAGAIAVIIGMAWSVWSKRKAKS